jgi:hypothetical protein
LSVTIIKIIQEKPLKCCHLGEKCAGLWVVMNEEVPIENPPLNGGGEADCGGLAGH